MQPPKVREVISRLEREGFELARCGGGRRIYRKDDRTVTIHGKDNDPVDRGTYGAIKRRAGW